MIHLEESDAMSAWVAAKDIGLSNPDDGPETKGCKSTATFQMKKCITFQVTLMKPLVFFSELRVVGIESTV